MMSAFPSQGPNIKRVWCNKKCFVTEGASKVLPTWRKPNNWGTTPLQQWPDNSHLYKIETCDGSDLIKLKGQKGIFAQQNVGEAAFMYECPGLYSTIQEFRNMPHKFKIEKQPYILELEFDTEPNILIIGDKRELWMNCNSGLIDTDKPNGPNISNSEFVWYFKNGFPTAYQQTMKKIKKNQQVLVYYGERYWEKRSYRFKARYSKN